MLCTQMVSVYVWAIYMKIKLLMRGRNEANEACEFYCCFKNSKYRTQGTCSRALCIIIKVFWFCIIMFENWEFRSLGAVSKSELVGFSTMQASISRITIIFSTTNFTLLYSQNLPNMPVGCIKSLVCLVGSTF